MAKPVRQEVLDTARIAAALAEATAVINREHTERLIKMTAAMENHIQADAVAFQALANHALEANKDLKSLLNTRSFLRGTWFAILMVGTFLGVVAGLVVAWYRG